MKLLTRFFLLLFICSSVFARTPVFDIHRTLPAPSFIIKGRIAVADYQVTNQQQSTLKDNGMQDPAKGVAQDNDEADTCASTFTLKTKQGCRLKLSIDSKKMPRAINSGPRICHTLKNPIFCSDPRKTSEVMKTKVVSAAPQNAPKLAVKEQSIEINPGHTIYLSVSNLSGEIAANNVIVDFQDEELAKYIHVENQACRHLPPGGQCELQLQASSSLPAMKKSVLIYGANTLTVTLPLRSYSHYALIANAKGQLFACLLSAEHQDLSQCHSIESPIPFTNPKQMAFEATTKTLYLSNQDGQTVSQCQLDEQAKVLSDCSNQGAFHGPLGLALGSQSQQIYIGGSTHDHIERCQLNQDNGHLSHCDDSGAGQIFDNGGFIVIEDEHLYIPHQRTNMVSLCQIDAQGKLINCGDAGSGRIFSNPLAIVLNPLPHIAYITSPGNSSLYTCEEDRTTGFLSHCQAASPAFNQPTAMALNEEQQTLYVVHEAGSQVSQCSLDDLGNLIECRDSQFNLSPDSSINSISVIDD